MANRVLSFRDAPAEFRAAALALRTVEAPIRRAVGQDMRATFGPVWRSELAASGAGSRDAILTAGARIAAGNPPSLVTASSTRKVGSGGGLVPTRHWAGFEYGANPNKIVSYARRSRGGGTHTVRRRVQAGHPARRRNGRVIGPAVRGILPRVASYWVQSVVRIVMDAAEGKR